MKPLSIVVVLAFMGVLLYLSLILARILIPAVATFTQRVDPVFAPVQPTVENLLQIHPDATMMSIGGTVGATALAKYFTGKVSEIKATTVANAQVLKQDAQENASALWGNLNTKLDDFKDTLAGRDKTIDLLTNEVDSLKTQIAQKPVIEELQQQLAEKSVALEQVRQQLLSVSTIGSKKLEDLVQPLVK